MAIFEQQTPAPATSTDTQPTEKKDDPLKVADTIQRHQQLISSIYGPDSMPMAQSLASQAKNDVDLGNYPAADNLYKQSAKIYENHHNDDALSTTLENYAKLKDTMGDSGAATDLRAQSGDAQKRYEISELFTTNAGEGAGPGQLAEPVSQLAELKAKSGDHANADRLYQKSIQLAEEGFGSNSKSLLPILQRYNDYEQSQGTIDIPLHDRISKLTESGDSVNDAPPELNSTETNLTRNLNLTKEVFGNSSKEAAVMNNNLADFYTKQPGREAQVEGLANDALAIVNNGAEENADQVIRAMSEKATAMSAGGSGESADRAQDAAKKFMNLDIAKMVTSMELNSTTPGKDVTSGLATLARAYAKADDYGKADEIFRMALNAHQEVMNDGTPKTREEVWASANVYKQYSEFLKKNGRASEAPAYEKKYDEELKPFE